MEIIYSFFVSMRLGFFDTRLLSSTPLLIVTPLLSTFECVQVLPFSFTGAWDFSIALGFILRIDVEAVRVLDWLSLEILGFAVGSGMSKGRSGGRSGG